MSDEYHTVMHNLILLDVVIVNYNFLFAYLPSQPQKHVNLQQVIDDHNQTIV